MLIRKCPDCAAYSHIDDIAEAPSCWNCGCFTDYSSYRTPGQKIVSLLNALAIVLFIAPVRLIVNRTPISAEAPTCARLSAFSRVALIVALPIALVCLVACNSMEISPHHFRDPELIGFPVPWEWTGP